MGLAILDALVTCMPPQRPLSEQERAAIAEPLGRVAWKYGANIPPEVALISALAFVGMGRWIEVKASKGDPVIVGGKLAGKADAANGEARAAA